VKWATIKGKGCIKALTNIKLKHSNNQLTGVHTLIPHPVGKSGGMLDCSEQQAKQQQAKYSKSYSHCMK